MNTDTPIYVWNTGKLGPENDWMLNYLTWCKHKTDDHEKEKSSMRSHIVPLKIYVQVFHNQTSVVLKILFVTLTP